MMKARQLTLVGAAFVLSVSAIACGPASQPAPAPAPSQGQPAASAPAPGAPAVAAVPGPGNQGTPKRGGIFRLSQTLDPPTFDPHATSRSLLGHHTRRTNNRLTRYKHTDQSGSLTVEGDLAEKWETSADLKTWTFILRKGVKFHNLPPVNGREFVADDVKYSYGRLMTGPTSVWKGQFDFIDRVEVIDKYTVRFHLKVANVSFLYRTSDGESSWIVAREVVEGLGGDYGKDPNKTLIGTGPFLFDKYDRGVMLSEKRNPDYHGLGFPGMPYLDGIEQLIINDPAAGLAAFVTKQIDTIGVPAKDVDRVKSSVPGVQITSGFGANSVGTSGIIINVTRPPFDNVKVRQALKYGVSQQNIIDGLYRGTDAVWKGFAGVGASIWALPESEIKQLWRHDPELSKRLLAEAGYPNGFKSEILIDKDSVAVVEVYVADLKKVGIDLSIKLEDQGVARRMVQDGNFFVHQGPHVSTAVEPDEVVKDGLVVGGSRNFMRLNDPIINDLAAKQTVMTNDQERAKVVHEINRRVAEIAPFVPVPLTKRFIAAHGYLKNWFPQSGSDDCNECNYWIEK